VPERVLYVADQETTCESEVGPARGLIVSVGTVIPTRDLRIVDLSLSGNRPDPFFLEKPHYQIGIEALLISLGEQMALPLRREADDAHYLPCQLLANCVRKGGVDGIRYPSALRPRGTKVVVFDLESLAVGGSKLVQIQSTSIRCQD